MDYYNPISTLGKGGLKKTFLYIGIWVDRAGYRQWTENQFQLYFYIGANERRYSAS